MSDMADEWLTAIREAAKAQLSAALAVSGDGRISDAEQEAFDLGVDLGMVATVDHLRQEGVIPT